MDEQNIRRSELIESLSLQGLQLRYDSRLCYCYIRGELGEDWDLERVVRECGTMHWLFNYTNYPIRCRQAFDYFAEFSNCNNRTYEYVKQNVHPHIKAETIMGLGGLPDRWPWLPALKSEKSDDYNHESEKSDDSNHECEKSDDSNSNSENAMSWTIVEEIKKI